MKFCEDCGTEMKLLLFSHYCPHDCDRKEKVAEHKHLKFDPLKQDEDFYVPIRKYFNPEFWGVVKIDDLGKREYSREYLGKWVDEAKPRKLKVNWSAEAAADLKAFHGLDIEQELISAFSKKIDHQLSDWTAQEIHELWTEIEK